MNERYIKLFAEIIHTTEVLAEKVMELDHNDNDEKGEQTAKIMRDDFAKLYDKFKSKDFNVNMLTKAECARILVGTLIVVQNIEERIKTEQQAVTNYKTDIIPKLQRIIDEIKEDENPGALINELFS